MVNKFKLKNYRPMAAAPAVAAVLSAADPVQKGAATVAIVVPPLVVPAGIERSRAASDFNRSATPLGPPRKAPGKATMSISNTTRLAQRQGKA